MKKPDDELLARLFRAGKRAAAREDMQELPIALATRVASRWAAGDIASSDSTTGYLIWRMSLVCAAANLIIITSLLLAMPQPSGGDDVALLISLP